MDALLRELLRRLMAGVEDPVADLPLAQLRVCSVLFRGPRPMSAIGRELGVSLSAMTQIADRLERAQLVKRVAHGNDRRVRCLRLTPRGRQMMRLHDEVRIRRMLEVLEQLTPHARKRVAAALQTMIRACAATKEQDGRPLRPAARIAASEALL